MTFDIETKLSGSNVLGGSNVSIYSKKYDDFDVNSCYIKWSFGVTVSSGGVVDLSKNIHSINASVEGVTYAEEEDGEDVRENIDITIDEYESIIITEESLTTGQVWIESVELNESDGKWTATVNIAIPGNN